MGRQLSYPPADDTKFDEYCELVCCVVGCRSYSVVVVSVYGGSFHETNDVVGI